MCTASTLDKEITHYLTHLYVKQKKESTNSCKNI